SILGLALRSAWWDDPPNPIHIILWSDGQLQDLGTFDDEESWARGISDREQIIGQARRRAFLWEGGRVRDLGTLPGATESIALALKRKEQVVGASGHAFLWERGRMRDLGTLGGSQSAATGINEAGEVVGFATDAAQRKRAFLWKGGRMRDLNDLVGGASGWVLEGAVDINGRGQVLGHGTRDGVRRAFLLTPR